MTKRADPIRRQITPELSAVIGRQLEIIRSRIGLSHAEAAKAAGIHLSTVYTIEAGTRSPHLMTILDILYAYDASTAEVVDFLHAVVVEDMRLRAVAAA
ncbi:MAG: helix-turn-helix transcriptional regulator [Acetobacter sp.]|uniref:helix-turn-helix transcriptional regulator n=1 Tax=Acetobacter sp. TaxID=440 RepID=UPI0039E760CE